MAQQDEKVKTDEEIEKERIAAQTKLAQASAEEQVRVRQPNGLPTTMSRSDWDDFSADEKASKGWALLDSGFKDTEKGLQPAPITQQQKSQASDPAERAAGVASGSAPTPGQPLAGEAGASDLKPGVVIAPPPPQAGVDTRSNLSGTSGEARDPLVKQQVTGAETRADRKTP